MTYKEATELIKAAANGDHPRRWLDLGCGSGTFTGALATMLPVGSEITGVDKAIQYLPSQMGKQVSVKFIQADYESEWLEISSLEGILLANSLHFVSDKPAFLRRLEQYFVSSRMFLIVEYDTSTTNPWVPFPIDFKGLKCLF